jgi:hypothetical protein
MDNLSRKVRKYHLERAGLPSLSSYYRLARFEMSSARCYRVRGSAVMIGCPGPCDENWPRPHHLGTLLTIQGVEPTNNTSERALSSAVICRKLRFGTQSPSGVLSGTPADGLVNVSTAEPQWLQPVGGRNRGQLQREDSAPIASPCHLRRASRLKSHTGP